MKSSRVQNYQFRLSLSNNFNRLRGQEGFDIPVTNNTDINLKLNQGYEKFKFKKNKI